MDSKLILESLKNESPFTAGDSLDEYLEGLQERLFKVTGIVLDIEDYDNTVIQLQRAGIIPIIN